MSRRANLLAAKMAELQKSTAMHFSSEAAGYYTEWQRKREEEWTASNDGFCMQIYSRLAPTVTKLGMLFELGSPDFDVSRPIRLEFIQEACRLVDAYLMPTARAVYDLVGSNAEKNVIDRITAYLKNHNGKATKREIMRIIKIKSADFEAYLDTMIESGIVETKTVKRVGKGRDTTYIFLLAATNVTNVSKVPNVSKVTNVDQIPCKDIRGSEVTLGTLVTQATLVTNGTEVQINRAEEDVSADDKLIINTRAKLACAVCGAELKDKGKVEKNGLFYCARPGCGYDWESEDSAPAASNEFGAIV